MKQLFLFLIIIILSLNLYCIDGSYIIDNRVNVRDFPSLLNSKIITQVQKDQQVIVNAKIIENDTINGVVDNWYLVGIIGSQTSGWIFGQFLVVDKKHNVENISIMRLYRNEYGSLLINELFNESKENQYSADLLSNYELIESRETTFWQMRDTGFKFLNRYKTEFGEISVFYNPDIKKWIFRQLIIENINISPYFKIGITIVDLESLIGKDYTSEGDIISYYQDIYWDAFVYEAEVSNGKVIRFILSNYFT